MKFTNDTDLEKKGLPSKKPSFRNIISIHHSNHQVITILVYFSQNDSTFLKKVVTNEKKSKHENVQILQSNEKKY